MLYKKISSKGNKSLITGIFIIQCVLLLAYTVTINIADNFASSHISQTSLAFIRILMVSIALKLFIYKGDGKKNIFFMSNINGLFVIPPLISNLLIIVAPSLANEKISYISNILITINMLIISIYFLWANKKSENRFQTILDITFVMIYYMVINNRMMANYEFFYKKSLDNTYIFTNFLIIIINVLAISIIFSLTLNERLDKKTNAYTNSVNILYFLITGFIGLLIVISTYYENHALTVSFFAKELIYSDLIFILTILLSIVTAFVNIDINDYYYKAYKKNILRKDKKEKKKNNELIVLIVLFFITIILVKERIVLVVDIIFIMIMLFAYYYISNYIKKSFFETVRIEEEKLKNETLKTLVLKRTSELMLVQRELKKAFIEDSLTGLVNRNYCLDLLNSYVKTPQKEFSVLSINLSKFKLVNDLHGHSAGDAVLKEIARRLKDIESQIKEKVKIARVGGDEFVIVYPSANVDKVKKLAKLIIEKLEEQILIGEYVFKVSANIGIISYPKDADTVEDLIKGADIATNQAKNKKYLNKICFYSKEYALEVEERHKLEQLLMTSDYESIFELKYKPQFNANKKVVAIRATLKWRAEKYKKYSNKEILKVADNIGIFHDLYKWLILNVISDIKKLDGLIDKINLVSIHTSSLFLKDEDFFDEIILAIDEASIEPSKIEFEFLQEYFKKKNISVDKRMRILKERGFSLALTEFGTGHFDFSHIQKYNIDRAKLSTQITNDAEDNEDNLKIIKTIMVLSKGLGFEVIIDNITNEKMFESFNKLGCNIFQGDYFMEEISFASLYDLLKDQ